MRGATETWWQECRGGGVSWLQSGKGCPGSSYCWSLVAGSQLGLPILCLKNIGQTSDVPNLDLNPFLPPLCFLGFLALQVWMLQRTQGPRYWASSCCDSCSAFVWVPGAEVEAAVAGLCLLLHWAPSAGDVVTGCASRKATLREY